MNEVSNFHWKQFRRLKTFQTDPFVIINSNDLNDENDLNGSSETEWIIHSEWAIEIRQRRQDGPLYFGPDLTWNWHFVRRFDCSNVLFEQSYSQADVIIIVLCKREAEEKGREPLTLFSLQRLSDKHSLSLISLRGSTSSSFHFKHSTQLHPAWNLQHMCIKLCRIILQGEMDTSGTSLIYTREPQAFNQGQICGK